MKFSMPIGKISEGKITQRSAQELYALNIGGHGGFYPIGSNNAYHGGLHFEDDNAAVLSIADGTIIAYRYNTDYITEKTADGVELKYSNCFVLIRHEYETPKGQKFVFYSHYNHLAPWNECKDKPYRPLINTKPGYKINTKRTLCTSADADTTTSETIGINELVAAVPVASSPGWAKLDNKERYILIKNNFASPVTLVEPPTLDEIVTCEIPIKAGMLIGYTGLCEAEGARGYRATHVEVFAGDDTEDFINNVKNDGKPKLLKIAKGKELKKRLKIYPNPSATLEKFTRVKGTEVEILGEGDGTWIPVKDKRLAGKVDYAWLIDKYNTIPKPNGHYTADNQDVEKLKVQFAGVEINGEDWTFESDKTITSATKFYWKEGKKTDSWRIIVVDVAEPAREYWVKHSLLTDKNGITQLSATTDECWSKNPDDVIVSTVGTVPYECVVSSKGTARDKDGVWHKVVAGNIAGWIKETDTQKVNPYNWLECGYYVVKEKEDDNIFFSDNSNDNSQIDYSNLNDFFKSVFDHIDTSKDKLIEEAELRAAFANQETAHKLSRLICYHQTEWYDNVDMMEEAINYVKRALGQDSADNLEKRIRNMCWWDDVSDVPSSKTVYHWNPVAFIEHMQSIPMCTIDANFFFEQYDKEFPECKLGQEQKNNIMRMFNSIEEYYENEKRQPNVRHLAYMMATAKHETAHKFAPIDEIGSSHYFEEMYDPVLGKDEKRKKMAIQNGNVNQGDGVKFHGRGYVQLTWHDNYKRAGEKFKVDLVNNRELAKNHELAMKIMLFGCETGMFTSIKLDDFINDTKTDYFNARTIINGYDMAETIEGYAEKMEKCLKLM
jgi:hypothetical protein